MLAGQLSIGWSNDALDAPRDAAAGRTDKPVATGGISARAVWLAAFASLLAALAMALAIGVVTAIILAVIVGAGWAYNLGLKSTPASGLMYILGFGPIPAYAASTLPGHPMPTWYATAVAALVGLGGHFANVLPDLAADRATGVNGLPQWVAARWGAGTVRAIVLVLLLSASVLLLLVCKPPVGRAGRAGRRRPARGDWRRRHRPGAVHGRVRHRGRRCRGVSRGRVCTDLRSPLMEGRAC